MVKLAFVLLFLLFSTVAFSETPPEHEEWYLVKNGMVVKSATNDKHYLKLFYENGLPQNLYLIDTSKGCHPLSADSELDAPFRINEVFVRYSQICGKSETLYYPTTAAGLEHLLSLFKEDNEVVHITSYDRALDSSFTTVRFSRIFDVKALTKLAMDNLDKKAEILRKERDEALEKAKKDAL